MLKFTQLIVHVVISNDTYIYMYYCPISWLQYIGYEIYTVQSVSNLSVRCMLMYTSLTLSACARDLGSGCVCVCVCVCVCTSVAVLAATYLI